MDGLAGRQVPVIVFTSTGNAAAGAKHVAMPPPIGLERFAAEDIVIVFCSGRTRAQLERLQQALAINHPFVCENGGGVFVPQGYFGFSVPHARGVAGYEAVEFGRPYAEVVGALRLTAGRLGLDVVGFSEMSIDEVATDCGVSLMEARLAKLREYDEPFRILAPDARAPRRRLFRALRAERLGCRTGWRYEHAGATVDKKAGVDLLRRLYERAFGSILALGVPRASGLPVWGDLETDAAAWADSIVDLARRHRRQMCRQSWL